MMVSREAAGGATVLGIDPSLRGCAFALGGVLGGTLGTLFEDVRKSNPAKDVNERVRRYRAIVDPLVEVARCGKPRLAVIESYAFGVQVFGLVDRAELGGILRDRLAPHCELILEVGTSAVKKWATGFGGGGKLPPGLTEQQRRQQLARRRKDSKTAVRNGIADLYGVRYEGDDADDQADAYALMRIGACLVGIDEPRTDAQREVVASLRRKSEERAV